VALFCERLFTRTLQNFITSAPINKEFKKKKKEPKESIVQKQTGGPPYKSHLFCIIYLFAFFFLSKNFVDLPQASKTIKYLRSTSLQRNHIPTQS